MYTKKWRKNIQKDNEGFVHIQRGKARKRIVQIF